MRRLIRNGELIDDEWTLIEDDHLEALPQGKTVLPLSLFLQHKSDLDYSRHAVYLDSDQDALELRDHVESLQLIVLRFPGFMDGRSFSHARVLRDQLEFDGELRAVGNFLQDQLFYLARCGVNAFLLPEGVSLESATASLSDFDEYYQAASDEPQPLFRRRV